MNGKQRSGDKSRLLLSYCSVKSVVWYLASYKDIFVFLRKRVVRTPTTLRPPIAHQMAPGRTRIVL